MRLREVHGKARRLPRTRSSPIGRPRLDAAIPQLIRRMARENPTWGAGASKQNSPRWGMRWTRRVVKLKDFAQLPGPDVPLPILLLDGQRGDPLRLPSFQT
jgi:hypothetical protein